MAWVGTCSSVSGKEAPLTAWGRQIRTFIHGSGNYVTLAPGAKFTGKEDLSSVYAMAAEGIYTIEACRELHGGGNVYSNQIVIPFIEPPQPSK